MCYNAAHPATWAKVFDIYSEEDIDDQLEINNPSNYQDHEGDGWFTDQFIMYRRLVNYENLKVLDRPIRRLEVDAFKNHVKNGDVDYVKNYDDAHCHRSILRNPDFVVEVEKQVLQN
jgi:hypothetical protein